jgi:class 3 adenylate cyclase
MDVNCTQCNATVPEDMAFCGQCGVPVRCICANCGAQNPAEFRFCGKCGNAIAVESLQALPSTETVSETGPLQISRSLFEGERRIVTVLFADAAGYTAMSERMDPEEVYRLMQGCFERMRQAVHQFEGSVNQYTGDGILALFGAPIAHEDSARRAVAAALEMQVQLESYANEVKSQYAIECAYRIGLNTGPVVVGQISESLQLDFAAIGDTVNLASRIQTLASPHTVCLSEYTFRAVADYFECEDLGERTVKGKSDPVHVYRAIGERSVQSRIEAAAARGLTEYVGRDRELQTLHGHLDEASRGHGQVVFVAGDAGVGKSRLLFEFRKSLVNKSPRWVEGKCISFGKNVPNLPIIDLVKSTFGVRESDDNSHISQRIDDGVAQWVANAQAVGPYLKYLLNVDPGDPAIATMTPMERRPGFVDALRTLVREESRQNPLVLVIEDLHWIDNESERMVNALADVVATAPVLMVLTSRPGYHHRLGERSYFHRIALSGLRPEDTASMAEKVLGAAGLPEEIRDLILAKAEGNPFYVEEVSKALVESGVLARRNGGYELGSEVTEEHIPETIQGVILARIDRLDPEARGAIQLASVIGREFSVRLLNRISDLEVKLDDALGELKALELIYETGYIPELSYMFKHALTHDVAYSTLLRERRQQLHRIVATAIETLYADRLPEHYEATSPPLHWRQRLGESARIPREIR